MNLPRFLRDNKAYDKYMQNCLANNFNLEMIAGFLANGSLSSGFLWAESPEGFEYWLDLSERFNGEGDE